MSSSSEGNAPARGQWTLDPAATSIGFAAKILLGLKAKGHFSRYEATIMVGESAADSSITVTIDTDSVDTGISMRDAHLRADNVFDVARFPTLEFRSNAVAQTPDGLDVTGDLRVRDVTRPVSFRAERVTGSAAPRYTAVVRVNPKEFGIARPGTTKPLDVLIDATLQRARG